MYGTVRFSPFATQTTETTAKRRAGECVKRGVKIETPFSCRGRVSTISSLLFGASSLRLPLFSQNELKDILA